MNKNGVKKINDEIKTGLGILGNSKFTKQQQFIIGLRLLEKLNEEVFEKYYILYGQLLPRNIWIIEKKEEINI